MKDLHTTRRQILKGAAAAGVFGALGVPAAGFADGEDEGRRVRWDLILVGSGCVAPERVKRPEPLAVVVPM